MKKVVYLYSGEGTRSSESGFKLIKTSPLWNKAVEIARSMLGIFLEKIIEDTKDIHRCPHSPLITVVSGICLADIWKRWGYTPDAVVGHSMGELAAAYEAGLYSLEDIILLTWEIGKITKKKEGVMLHGTLTADQIDQLEVSLSSINFDLDDKSHVTVSGSGKELDRFRETHPHFLEMQTPHPWHHKDYQQLTDDFEVPTQSGEAGLIFSSGVTGQVTSTLDPDHWRKWLSQTIDFRGAVAAISTSFEGEDVEIIEIGFHPVLEQNCQIFPKKTYVSSMYRGEDENEWILFQRKKLDQTCFEERVKTISEEYHPGLDHSQSLAYQGFSSLRFVEFTALLAPLFPGLAPQDFYRYKSVSQLLDRFGGDSQETERHQVRTQKNEVVITGMSCRIPEGVESPRQFWDVLIGGEDQVKANKHRGDFEAGFLGEKNASFDHKFFNISEAEAKTIDPQQMLALELTELLFRDAGIDPETLDKKRVGVYVGAWNDEFRGDKNSVFYPIGTNPSIIASRISYHYDLRGPSWVVNTACSSSLVAVHYAAKDIEAGRVDFAIAGGVNMLLGNDYTHMMRDSGFLSKDQRCKTFDDSANGYVRAEGGGLVLLVRKDLTEKYYAQVQGSSINQNGRRAQVITAPHPEAQEELIVDACHEAGISPADINYLECHGTGTKIGDPIEISALQNSVAKNRETPCLLGAVKSNIGHLESAAGIAGLIKGILALNHGKVPANLHFNKANQFIDFSSNKLEVVAETTELDHQALVGISSFGFGGANGHVIIQGVQKEKRKTVEEQPSPFDKARATPLDSYYSLEAPSATQKQKPSGQETQTLNVKELVGSIFFELTGIKEIDADVDLTDQGLDSLSATQFISTLQERLGVELDADVLFDYPLLDQLTSQLQEISGMSGEKAEEQVVWSREKVAEVVRGVFYELTNIKEIEPDVELTDQGLDSLSATQLFSMLEARLGCEIDTDILFDYPLFDQLVDQLLSEIENQTA
jgi:acyl transferase domain-containing protein/acyl carrier protein